MERIATWGPLPDESEPAFEAFKHYRDAGPQRSLQSTARALGKSKSLLERWSSPSRHRWQERVAAWDLEQEDLRRDARIKAIEDAEERHTKLARAMLGKVARELGAMQKRACQACGRGGEALTPAQMARFLRVGVDVERAALGLGSTSGGPSVAVNVAQQQVTTVAAGGATALVLLRDPDTQRLASELLGRMKTLDPATSLRKKAEADATPRKLTGWQARKAAHAKARGEALEPGDPIAGADAGLVEVAPDRAPSLPAPAAELGPTVELEDPDLQDPATVAEVLEHRDHVSQVRREAAKARWAKARAAEAESSKPDAADDDAPMF